MQIFDPNAVLPPNDANVIPRPDFSVSAFQNVSDQEPEDQKPEAGDQRNDEPAGTQGGQAAAA